MTVLDLDEIRDHLNITNESNDFELWGFLEAAEAIIAERVGPLEPTTFTSIVDSTGGSLVLPAKPVISLTSLTLIVGELGATPGPSNLLLNGETGEVTTSTGYGLAAGRYSVTYVAGRPDGELPASLRMAVKEMVRHLWKSQRAGGSAKPGSSADSTPAAGYLIPYAVAELIQPHRKFTLGFI